MKYCGWGVAEPMEFLLRDLRLALRNFAKHPTCAVVPVITTALGIGANTAIFSVVNGVLIRDLPHQKSEQLVRIWSAHMERGHLYPGLESGPTRSRAGTPR